MITLEATFFGAAIGIDKLSSPNIPLLFLTRALLLAATVISIGRILLSRFVSDGGVEDGHSSLVEIILLIAELTFLLIGAGLLVVVA